MGTRGRLAARSYISRLLVIFIVCGSTRGQIMATNYVEQLIHLNEGKIDFYYGQLYVMYC
jgi:hypothetical protein